MSSQENWTNALQALLSCLAQAFLFDESISGSPSLKYWIHITIIVQPVMMPVFVLRACAVCLVVSDSLRPHGL